MKNSRQTTSGGFGFKKSMPQYRARDWLIRLLHASSVGMTVFKIRRPGSLFDDRVHDMTLPRRNSACSLRHCLVEGPTSWRDSMKFRDTYCMPSMVCDHRKNSKKDFKKLTNYKCPSCAQNSRFKIMSSSGVLPRYADRCRGKLACPLRLSSGSGSRIA
jgi:hypothetical protein